MKIYTKFGDAGKTMLIGATTTKDDGRVCAYGDVDELNALLGVILSFADDRELGAIVEPIQNDLFVIGTDLANPGGEKVNKISPTRVSDLEKSIHEYWEKLPALTHFIIPGGTKTASLLHLARTICRRAERSIVALATSEKVNPDILAYMNRLSDLLFTLARYENRKKRIDETIWKGKKVTK